MSRAVLIIANRDDLMPGFYSKIKESGIDCDLQINITVSKQYERFTSRLYIDFHGELNVADWLDEDEDAVDYRALFGDIDHETLFVYYVSFGDLFLAKQILLLIGNSERLVIDGDSDVVLAGNEFVRKIQDDPNWDWA